MTSIPHPTTPASLLDVAEASLLSGDSDTAKARARQAVALAEALGDRLMLARAVTMSARILFVRDETDASMAMALRAIGLSRAVDDLPSLANAHGIAARILMSIGETDAALAECTAALEASEGSNNLRAAVAPVQELANIYGQLGQWERALEFGERYCETARLLGDRATESSAIDTVAWIYGSMRDEAAERGDTTAAVRLADEAERRSRAAMSMAREAGSQLGEATCLANLAESLSDLGRHDEALALLDSWRVDPTRMAPTVTAHHGHTRGIVLGRLGRHAEAVDLLSRCVDSAPTRMLEITARRALAEVLEKTGDLGAALDHHKRLAALISEHSSEKARRAASVTAVRLETARALALADRYQAQATDLQRSNERLNRRSRDLQRQALEDQLTGLPNRRRLDELLATDQHGYSIVMVDVDHFKRVNDDHSHLVGDAVLRELARLLRANCRAGDLALRFGGEEFALLLVSLTAEGAMAAAERARAALQAHAWGELSPGLSVTASFGVALNGEAATSAALLALADERLYLAKAGGRNRVVGPP